MPVGAVWTPEEDERLRQLIKEEGAKRWSTIASKLGTKCGKQCRRRWKNFLSLDVRKGTWSTEEDQLLIEGHEKYGNRWTEIAKIVGGRTDNAVKNRWAALCKKLAKNKASSRHNDTDHLGPRKTIQKDQPCHHHHHHRHHHHHHAAVTTATSSLNYQSSSGGREVEEVVSDSTTGSPAVALPSSQPAMQLAHLPSLSVGGGAAPAAAAAAAAAATGEQLARSSSACSIAKYGWPGPADLPYKCPELQQLEMGGSGEACFPPSQQHINPCKEQQYGTAPSELRYLPELSLGVTRGLEEEAPLSTSYQAAAAAALCGGGQPGADVAGSGGLSDFPDLLLLRGPGINPAELDVGCSSAKVRLLAHPPGSPIGAHACWLHEPLEPLLQPAPALTLPPPQQQQAQHHQQQLKQEQHLYYQAPCMIYQQPQQQRCPVGIMAGAGGAAAMSSAAKVVPLMGSSSLNSQYTMAPQLLHQHSGSIMTSSSAPTTATAAAAGGGSSHVQLVQPVMLLGRPAAGAVAPSTAAAGAGMVPAAGGSYATSSRCEVGAMGPSLAAAAPPPPPPSVCNSSSSFLSVPLQQQQLPALSISCPPGGGGSNSGGLASWAKVLASPNLNPTEISQLLELIGGPDVAPACGGRVG